MISVSHSQSDAQIDVSAGEITRQKIMDAAETLIIEHGFAATSLRAIATAAGVNLAATHYHFGSKQGLLAAVFHRRLGPLSDARLAALSRLQAGQKPPDAYAILEAFFLPFFQAQGSELLAILPGLVGRMYAESARLVQPILEEEVLEVATRYIAALEVACPGVAVEELQWRFHFMIGAMIQLLRFQAPLGREASEETLLQGLDRLLAFSTAGIEQTGGGL
ncbi:MAG: TetR family transcriptional regulator [Pseudomonadota bacterium]|nr:TetR family transcriptional regulator [Pseudomonadota bacterium]